MAHGEKQLDRFTAATAGTCIKLAPVGLCLQTPRPE